MDAEVSWQVIHEFRQVTRRIEVTMTSPRTTSQLELPEQQSQAQRTVQEEASRQARTHECGPESPIDAIQKSLVSGRFSDLTVIHGDRRWNAHQLVVCSQSSVLESQMVSEPSGMVLNISSYDDEAAGKMIEYFYKGSYMAADDTPSNALRLHIKLFILASRLKIQGLAHLAGSLFRTVLVERVRNLDTYFTSIIHIYAATTAEFPQLREAVVDTAVNDIARMLAEPHVRRKLMEILTSCPEFLGDVLTAMSLRGANAVEVPVGFLPNPHTSFEH
ncbi:BTB/POZ domain-containing protein [Phlyctema vagabunda]|uniref:BTB/POZ domain-containing protein n=1 Tax=Phlyctema vagabunda TaxID=108571 RepID=A0ABR4PNW1_9HELO